MSLILEALNRSRREQRNVTPVPGVDSIHYEPGPAQHRRRWLWLLVAVVVFLALGFLLGRLFGGSAAPIVQAPLPAAPAPAPAVAASAALSPPAREQVGVSAPAPPRDTVLREPVEAVPGVIMAAEDVGAPVTASLAANPDIAALYERRSSPALAAGNAQPVMAEVASTLDVPAEGHSPADRVGGAETLVHGSSIDIGSLATAAEQALKDVRLEEHPAPFLVELSQQRKDAIPTLMYLQHDYRSDGGSSVTINGQQTAAGQALRGGLRVEEILSDSVVLSQDGEQFRLRALNSWVNL